MERGINNPHVYTGPGGVVGGASMQGYGGGNAPGAGLKGGLTFHYVDAEAYATAASPGAPPALHPTQRVVTTSATSFAPAPTAVASTDGGATATESPKSEDPREYFMPGHQYSRQDIHDRFGAQRKGPVATPHDHLPYLFLFVRLRKEANAQWSDNVLYYTGEGKTGDMEWKGGNKLLRESPAKGKQILLFTVVERVAATAQYEGEVALLGVDLVDEPDKEGGVRKVFVFRLAPVGWTYGDRVTTSPTPAAAAAAASPGTSGMVTRKRKQEQQMAGEQATTTTEIKGMMTRGKRQELEALQKYEQQQQQHHIQQPQGMALPPSVLNYPRLTPEQLQKLAAGHNPFHVQQQPQFGGDASMQHEFYDILQPPQFYSDSMHGQQQQQQQQITQAGLATNAAAANAMVKQETSASLDYRPVDQVRLLALMREAMQADKRVEELELCHATIVNALTHDPHKYILQ